MKLLKILCTLILSVSIVTVAYLYERPCECESILPKQEQAFTALQGQMECIENSITKIASDYTDKLDETTRQNVRLLQEVADQHNQIELLEGMEQ